MKRISSSSSRSASRIDRLFSLCSAMALAGSASQAADFQFGELKLTVPDGFIIEQIAGPPLADRPIEADFDEQGRLYVTDSSGSNARGEQQIEEKSHRVLRLEDTDGDGHFDKRTVFADQMMFPEGAMWFDGSLYVGAPPSIWKLTDTDGDGVADKREEWFQGKVLTGCANDVHGPYLGPDGYIYWTKGAFAKQTVERPGREPFVTRAAHIYRARPDGSGFEPVMTGGMDNPVGVAFTPAGERIFTTTFFQNPEGGRRDGLVHAIYGGVYGKPNDVVDDHPRTGGLMPVLTHLGPAAPAGVTRYESEALGASFRDNLFTALFNLRKVTRHTLQPEGATFKTIDEDFITSDHPDFHPTDVFEDADGSLIVIDTGGWYKICCPTSQLAKPDVLGGIYRIRRQGAPRVEDPRGLNLAWEKMSAGELARLLGDARPAVRSRATQTLARRGAEAAPALAATARGGSPEARLAAVKALAWLDHSEARAATRAALVDANSTVAQTAAFMAGLWRDAAAVPALSRLLEHDSPHLRRAAAEALGRTGDKSAVPALLAAAAKPADRALEHAITFALIEIADASGTAAGLAAAESGTRRAALIALDQMKNGGLQPEQVTPLLSHPDPILKEAALWIVSRHSDWGPALAGYLKKQLAQQNLSDAGQAELRHQLAQFARVGSIQELMAETLAQGSPAARRAALQGMARAGLKQPPRSWIEGIANSLQTEKDPAILRDAISARRAAQAAHANDPDATPALLQLARNPAFPDDLRLAALAALPSPKTPLDPALFGFLTAQLDASHSTMDRGAAAAALGRQKLDAGQLQALIAALPSAGPLELPKLLGAFDGGGDEALGAKLIAGLKSAKGVSALRGELLLPRLEKFPASVRKQAEDLLASLNADAARQQAKLGEMEASLKGGDIRRGQVVFNSAKAACSSCHAIGYLGGKLGPDLTTIGTVRTERDLIESIVFPSASFVRSFEPMIVATKAGEQHSGVLLKDAEDEVTLASGPGAEVRIAREDIAEMRPGAVSVMPAGLDEQLSRQEMADLIAFLKGTKWGPN